MNGGLVLHGLVFTRVTSDQRRVLQDLLAHQMRRTGVRLSVEITVMCQPKDQYGPPLEGRTRDISRTGMSIRLPQTLSPGTAMHLTMHTPGGPFAAEGEVVWAEVLERRPPGMPSRHGVRFTALGPAKSLTLGILLADTM
jgi:hypothetical protein